MKITVAVVLVLATVAYVSPAGKADDWPMDGHDAGHSGTSGLRAQPNGSWTTSLGSGVFSYTPAIIVDDKVVVGVPSLAAFRITDGSRVWSAERGVGSSLSIAYSRPFLVVANESLTQRYVTALWATNGTIAWSNVVGDTGLGGVVAAQGVAITSTGYDVVGVDTSDGHLLWKEKLDGPSATTPAIAGSNAIFLTTNTSIYALNLSTGSISWRVKSAAGFSAPPVVAGDLLVDDASGRLTRLDPETGAIRWESNLPAGAEDPTIIDGRVYTVGADENHKGRIVTVDWTTGRVLATALLPHDGLPWMSPRLMGGHLIFETFEGWIEELSPSGSIIGETQFPGSGTHVLLGAGDFVLHAEQTPLSARAKGALLVARPISEVVQNSGYPGLSLIAWVSFGALATATVAFAFWWPRRRRPE